MTENVPKARPSRWKLYLLLAFFGLLLMVAAGLWYTTTESFQSYVRLRIIDVLERETGGRVELGAYHTIPLHLQVEIRNLTIHGLEAADQTPLAHVDSVVARIKIISLLQKQFGFESLVLDHPVVHLIVYPDGSTNQPEPKVARAPSGSPVETIFSMSVNQFSVRRGEFLWNDQKVPFDIDARNLAADATYSFLRRRFDSHVVFGKVDTVLPGTQPFIWTAATHFTLGRRSLTVESFTWDTGHSHVEFHGLVRDFRNPTVQGNYTAKLDLLEAGAILRLPGARWHTRSRGSWFLVGCRLFLFRKNRCQPDRLSRPANRRARRKLIFRLYSRSASTQVSTRAGPLTWRLGGGRCRDIELADARDFAARA